MVAFALTAVAKSCILGEGLAFLTVIGRLWQPRAMQLPIGQSD